MLRVMPQDDDMHDWTAAPTNWAEEQARRVALEVRRLRLHRKLSAQALSARTATLGSAVSRSVISDLEIGRRRYVTTAELVVLAQSLEVSPLELLFGDDNGIVVGYLPGEEISRLEAVQRFSGINEGVLREYEEQIENLLEAALAAKEAARLMRESAEQNLNTAVGDLRKATKVIKAIKGGDDVG